MKLTDLRDELTARAGESEQHAYHDLLPGVRRKVRSTKRHRLAGAAAGVAVAIVAAGLVPGLTGTSTPDPATGPRTGPDGMPTREPAWDPARDLNKNGITFLHRIAGETLLTGAIGDKGQAEIRTTLVPPSTEIELRYFCSSKARPNTRLEIQYGIGVIIHDGDCSRSQVTVPLHESGSTVRTARDATDKPAPVVMRLIDKVTRQPVTDSSVLLAVGAYVPGPQRAVGPVKIPELYQHQGFDYRLAGIERGRLAPGAKVGITTPADTPFLVAYGGYGGSRGAVAVDLICGNTQGDSDWVGVDLGAHAWAMCPARPGGRTEVRWSGQGTPGQGEMFVAIYTQQR